MNQAIPLLAGFVLRPMTEEDLADVLRIEEATQVTPWSMGVFRDCLRGGYQCQVMAKGEQIAGFLVVSRVLDEAHLLNIAVAPAQQRRGLAWATIHALCDDLLERDTGFIYLEVREGNQGARTLYERLGFEVTGVRKDYYRKPGGREHAILMLLRLRGDHK